MAMGTAVLGLDHWYTAFGVLGGAAASAAVPLVAVYDRDTARRAEVAAMYPGVLVTDSADAAISASGVELVAICARTGDAVELAERALLAGKHVVTVKPFARNIPEAERLVQVAAETGTFLGAFEGMQRLHSRANTVRELIASGAVGEIVAFHQVGHAPLPAPWRGAANGGDSWWLDPAQVPGGAWIDHAIYAVDFARYVLRGEVTQTVGATFANRVHKMPLEDYGAALLLLQTETGATVTLSLTNTWCAESGGYNEYRFIGTRGTITADGGAWVVETATGTTRHEAEGGAYFRFERLAQLLENGEMPPFGAVDAVANLTACLDAYAVGSR